MEEGRKFAGYKPRKNHEVNEANIGLHPNKVSELLKTIQKKNKFSNFSKSPQNNKLNKFHEINGNNKAFPNLEKSHEIIDIPTVANNTNTNGVLGKSTPNSFNLEEPFFVVETPDAANQLSEGECHADSLQEDFSLEKPSEIIETPDAANGGGWDNHSDSAHDDISLDEPSEIVETPEIANGTSENIDSNSNTDDFSENKPSQIVETPDAANGPNETPNYIKSFRSNTKLEKSSKAFEPPSLQEINERLQQLEKRNNLNTPFAIPSLVPNNPNLTTNKFFKARANFYEARTDQIHQELQRKRSKDFYSTLLNQAAKVCVAAAMICITLAISYRAVGLANQLCERIQDELTKEACRIASWGIGCLVSGGGFFSIAKVMRAIDKKLFNPEGENTNTNSNPRCV